MIKGKNVRGDRAWGLPFNSTHKPPTGGSFGKESAYDVGDMGLIPGLRRAPGEGILQYSCLENPMDREAQRATVHGVAKVRQD